MQQNNNQYESWADAFRAVVQSLGGTKKVGEMMRPEKPVDEAGRWVADCLNPDRREKFDPEQVLLLLRAGRRVGCHAAMSYMTSDAGYEMPRTVSAETQLADALQQMRSMQDSMASMASTIEKLSDGMNLGSGK